MKLKMKAYTYYADNLFHHHKEKNAFLDGFVFIQIRDNIFSLYYDDDLVYYVNMCDYSKLL